MQEFEKRVFAVEALFAIAVYLVEGVPNRHATLLEFHLNQWQAVDQDRDIVAVGMATRLLKLLDHLHLVASKVPLIEQVDVLNPTVIEYEVVDVVVVNLPSLINGTFACFVEKGFHEAQPLSIGKLHVVQGL